MMRLYIKLSRNTQIIPFSYQHLLTGTLHKWIGENNNEHGNQSLYSFSWLQYTSTNKKGINLGRDSYFFISAYDSDLIKKITQGILADPEAFCGSKVIDVQIKDVPEFSNEERFFLNSPILIRQKDGKTTKHITYQDEDFEMLLTDNLKSKLKGVNISDENVIVEFDLSPNLRVF